MDYETSYKSVDLKTASEQCAGRYEILEPIGQGGMACVFKAIQLSTGRHVALKYIKNENDAPATTQQIKRFKEEVAAIAQMAHPNIVSIVDFDTDAAGQPFIVMEYIEGSSLAELIKQKSAIPYLELLNIIKAVCDGLAHSHSKNIIHRDLKPSNIMISKESSGQTIVKVVDFGIAKKRIGTEDGMGENAKPTLTQTGEVVGSPVYMSPEQCLGHEMDQRSDIYSLGCLMFEALTGALPFKGENAMEIIAHRLTVPPLKMAEVAPQLKVPDSVEFVISKALERDQAKRYQSVSALKDDVENILQNRPVRAPKSSGKHSKKTMIVAAVAALSILGAIELFFLLSSSTKTAEMQAQEHKTSSNTSSPAEAGGADPSAVTAKVTELASLEDNILKLEHSQFHTETQSKFKKAVELSSQLRGKADRRTLGLLIRLGDSCRDYSSDFKQAGAAYSEAESRYLSAKMPYASVVNQGIILRLGIVALHYNNDAEAKSYFEDALKQADLLKDPGKMMKTQSWLAQTQSKFGKHLEAAQLWDESTKNAAKAYGPDSFQSARCMTGAAKEYLQTNQKATAIPLLQRSLKISRAVGNVDYVAKIESCLTHAGVKPL